MNRRSIIDLCAMSTLVLALLPASAIAQQKTLKEQLVGTWTLVSAEAIEPNGATIPLVKGANVKGQQIFTDGGRMSFQVIGEHSDIGTNDRMKMTADEMKSLAESVLSYFGTYTVNEADKSYTVLIESSSFANQTATPGKRMVAMNGDQMTLTNPGRLAGGQTKTVWKRAK